MICPVIHPEPCPDPEACATGWPCERVLALQEERYERISQFVDNIMVVDGITLHSYGPTLHPLPAMEGQIAIVPTPEEG